MKNILVTGGLGYIGSHTCLRLVEAGYNPIVIDNLSNSDRSVLSRLYDITGRDICFFEADISDRHTLSQILEAYDIYACIHFAALKSVGESIEKPLAYYNNNICGTVTLLKALRTYNVRNFIFSSSAAVYGAGSAPFTEDMPAGGITNPYGMTKLMTEQILSDVYASEGGWNISVLRYFNPIGADASGLIGENPKGEPGNLMPYITKVAAGELECLSVFGNDYDTPDGTCIRDYIHVLDLAAGHVLALSHIEETGYDVFNLGRGCGVSVLELVKTFERVNGVRLNYRIAGRRAGDVAVVYADCSKAEKVLGFRAERNVESMCEDSWRWQRYLSEKKF